MILAVSKDTSITSLIIIPMSLAATFDWSASFLIWSATTAKPLPASPALAASIEALRERSSVSSAISEISVIAFSIL